MEAYQLISDEQTQTDKRDKIDSLITYDYIRDASGKIKKPQELFDLWEKCLKVWDLYQEFPNKAEVSRKMGWFNKDYRPKCTEEITLYLNFTKKLINSTTLGTFFNQASKPMTEGKKRKPRSTQPK